jgi:thiol-disulfide isomerase/thioredoxin
MALLEFYGETCPHCIEMKPLVEKLEKELGVTVEKYEVWNDEENAKKQTEYDKGLCGGVPFFINTEAKKFLCGSVDEEELKAWMQGTGGSDVEEK